MRELSACDFCGGEAAGVYEVVPGEISGVSARRMVLCEDCRDTLADIVDPLLDAGRAGGRAKSKQDSGGREAADAAPGAGRAGELAAESGADAGGEAEVESRSGQESEPEPSAEPTPKQPIEPEPVPSAEPESEPEHASEPEPEPDSEPEPIERPEGYGKVVRLVENRDDGIERSDLEELASGAYDLSTLEVEEAIDFAIERGTFEETGDGLKTT